MDEFLVGDIFERDDGKYPESYGLVIATGTSYSTGFPSLLVACENDSFATLTRYGSDLEYSLDETFSSPYKPLSDDTYHWREYTL